MRAKQRERGRGGWNAAAGSETMLSPYILFPVRIKSEQQLGWRGQGDRTQNKQDWATYPTVVSLQIPPLPLLHLLLYEIQ